ncbi:MAG: molybdopterin-dependent oxidoreductase [Chloroflexi bacterium]|nr:molybdopterin-dependent oxidoreductase [Chloroflexota bacterium]
MSRETVHESLPTHPVPSDRRALAETPALQITGLVAQPLLVTSADLEVLTRVDLADDFACEEGWSVPGLRWQGVRLADVLMLAQPDPSARFVRVCSGEYAVPLPLPEAERAVLCDQLNGRSLPVEHGAPWRLVVPGGVCHTSVKWVDRLEVALEAGDNSGQRIALARIER